LSEIGGSGERQLTNETAEWPIREFAVSPEGDRIAYLLYQDPPSGDAVIKQVHIPTGEVTILLGESDQCSEIGVDWLDETHVTFSLQGFAVAGYKDDDSPCDFWGNEPSDRRVVDLTTGERSIVSRSLLLTQSPDGRYWLTGYCYPVHECPPEYVLHDLATGEQWPLRRLQVAETGFKGLGHFFGWSPNSQWMLFADYKGSPYDGPLLVQLVTIDTATREERTITTSKNIALASWSPDGQMIAFTQSDPGGRGTCETELCGLWLIESDGGNVRQVPVEMPYSWHFGSLDWSPDGSRLVFSGGDDSSVVWSVRLDGTDLRPIITRAELPHVLREH
jgi:Tol biopolymer transport system component